MPRPNETPKSKTPNIWAYFSAAWVCVILFSSTSLAWQLCEQAFHWVSELLFGRKVMQQPSFDIFHLLADKAFHVMLFLVLAILLWRALPASTLKIPQVLLCGLVVGSCSEFLQRFFPGRDPALRDVLINVCGTAVGVACSLMVAKHRGHPAPTAYR